MAPRQVAFHLFVMYNMGFFASFSFVNGDDDAHRGSHQDYKLLMHFISTAFLGESVASCSLFNFWFIKYAESSVCYVCMCLTIHVQPYLNMLNWLDKFGHHQQLYVYT